ncbi:STAS/SEC14 domain-containing protein [Flavobacterium sp. TAB 87]|uniref:STAS/SEC14 domain-containing protein n=1 Tax=Flavobacterium sp. TAB 87 TaxID=1729581 RepID=UPI00076C1198|nr:STAS/SEC14 domain-containing protein [Flavobacterium sp. TAB 87]KVV15800.1 hypothetical protein AP058_00640 [Flavobacterium sp. TAB 87]
MMKLMSDLPDDVLGIVAEGKITPADYETVLIPAVDKLLEQNEKIKIIYQLAENFENFDVSAMIDDSKIGMKHLAQWDKVALVSNHRTINTFVKFFSYLMPCEVRVFANDSLLAAKQWIVL